MREAKLVCGRAYIRYVPGLLGKRGNIERLNEVLIHRDKPFVARTRHAGRIAGTTNDLIQRYLYLFGVWEPHLTAWLRNRLRPGDVFVDVGANIGYFSLVASRLVGPAGRVVAIEASPSIFAELQDNLARNEARNVRAVQMAATERPCEVPLFEGGRRNRGKTSIVAHGRAGAGDSVAGRPLADILTEEELAVARVIKVDVEGAEAQVLAGLLPALHRLRGDVELAIEVNARHLAGQGLREDAITAPLFAAGFSAFRIPNSYKPWAYLSPTVEWPTPWKGPLRGEAELIFSRAGGE